MAKDNWAPQPHYTGGEIVLFWDGKELVELRMADTRFETVVRAAETLHARFFFLKVGYDHRLQTYVWDAYDAREARIALKSGSATLKIAPRRTFETNDTAPLIMWAAAKGGVT